MTFDFKLITCQRLPHPEYRHSRCFGGIRIPSRRGCASSCHDPRNSPYRNRGVSLSLDVSGGSQTHQTPSYKDATALYCSSNVQDTDICEVVFGSDRIAIYYGKKRSHLL